jgi:HrpA-like RNA helicase
MERQLAGSSLPPGCVPPHNCDIRNHQQTPGDILIFLTGREEIDRCLEELSELLPTYVIVCTWRRP